METVTPAAGAATATPAAAAPVTPEPTALGAGTPSVVDATALGEQPKGAVEGAGQGQPVTPTAPVALVLPEGVTLDEKVMEDYKKLVEKFDPQKGLEFLVAAREGAVNDLQKQVTDKVKEQRTKWLADAKADKEIGGTAWEDSILTARKAVDILGGDTLRELLNKSGLGDHPGIIRAFVRVGKSISEDSIAGKGVDAPTPKTADEKEAALHRKLYPNSPTMFPQDKE
jgi:hypothetical protein